jgi:ATP-dependent 26S proteasome regulatory subunit
MAEEHPLQVARCTKIIRLPEDAPLPALAPGAKPNADEQDKYVINVKQIAKFVVALGDRVAPTDIEEGMRVGCALLLPSLLLIFLPYLPIPFLSFPPSISFLPLPDPFLTSFLSPLSRHVPPISNDSVDRTDYKIMIPLPPKIDASVTMMQVEEKPDVTYQDVGGCKEQIEKLREVVETPLLTVLTPFLFSPTSLLSEC